MQAWHLGDLQAQHSRRGTNGAVSTGADDEAGADTEPYTADHSSRLHLADRLKQSYGRTDRGHHPQQYAALPTLAEVEQVISTNLAADAQDAGGESRRQLQSEGTAGDPEIMTKESTNPLELKFDTSGACQGSLS